MRAKRRRAFAFGSEVAVATFFGRAFPGDTVAVRCPKERKRGPAGSVGLTLGQVGSGARSGNGVDFAGSARPPKTFRFSWLRVMGTLGPSSLRRHARGGVRAFCCAQVNLTCQPRGVLDGSHVGAPWAHCLPTAEGPFPAFPGPPSVCSAACRALCAVAGRCAVCPAACVRPAGRQRVCGGVPPGGWPPRL